MCTIEGWNLCLGSKCWQGIFIFFFIKLSSRKQIYTVMQAAIKWFFNFFFYFEAGQISVYYSFCNGRAFQLRRDMLKKFFQFLLISVSFLGWWIFVSYATELRMHFFPEIFWREWLWPFQCPSTLPSEDFTLKKASCIFNICCNAAKL